MKKKNFTQIPNRLLNDDNLSLKAKGLYSYMQSKPEKWAFHLNGMQKQLKESRGTIISIINELVTHNYIKKIKIKKNGKQQVNQYILLADSNKQIPNVKVEKSESKNSTDSNTVNSNMCKSNTLSKRVSFKNFKATCIDNYKNQSFTTKGIGWLKTTKFQINDAGYIVNTLNNKLLDKEESFKVWQYLYKNYLQGTKL
ncbi:hypothetical protein [Sulfurimonas sp.]